MRKVLFLLMVMLLKPFLTQAQDNCHPIVEGVRFDGEYDSAISARLAELYDADQADREPGAAIDVPQLIEDDRARREEVLVYLQAGQIINATDLHRAALIFQHGDCPEHYRLAADLALRSYEAGNSDASWLYTAATDRYLMSTGQLQIYGTQYVTNLRGKFVLCPVDGTITDDERSQWGLSSLDELQARAQEFDELFNIDPHRWSILSRIPLIGQTIDAFYIYKQCLR